jgi:O-succinylhomoserine sulfhydrylase
VRTAAAIAEALEGHPAISRVLYPYLPSFPQHDLARRQMTGGGTLVTFEMAGDGAGADAQAAAFTFMDALEVIDISNNLGDAKSMVTHPNTTTHRAMPEDDRHRMGITSGIVRLSVGLEAPADLIADLTQALDHAQRMTEAASKRALAGN